MYLIIATLSLVLLFGVFLLICSSDYKIHAQNATIAGPKVTDSNLKVELVARNLDFPTAIDFLGNDDLLLTEKNTGNVYEIINGNITAPLIHLNVTTRDERGLLGLAISGMEITVQKTIHSFIFTIPCVEKVKLLILRSVAIMYIDMNLMQKTINS